jgi:hypothetical protein
MQMRRGTKEGDCRALQEYLITFTHWGRFRQNAMPRFILTEDMKFKSIASLEFHSPGAFYYSNKSSFRASRYLPVRENLVHPDEPVVQ